MHKSWEDEASFGDFILSHLLSCGSLKLQREMLYELVQKRRALNRQVFNNALYRLQKKGVLSFDSRKAVIINRKTLRLHTLFKKITAQPSRDTKILVLFDIPEKKRKIRNWLRSQLKLWDFEMLQQSVWLGWGPLPEEFTNHLRLLGIYGCVKTFKIRSQKRL